PRAAQGHDHHGDGEPHGHHGEYAEIALVPPARVDPDALTAWLRAVGTRDAAPVLRAKGTVLLPDGGRVELQGVDGRLELRPTGRPGPDRLSLLGAGLDREELRHGLAGCAAS
ncbi:GTP-binding protein, partial [Patulibacter sp. S7RM1-6]